MKKETSYSKAFTLIEIVIVCSVLAILAAISVVMYQNLQKRAADTAIFKDLKSASEQLELMYVRSPETFSTLDSLPDGFVASDDVVVHFVPTQSSVYYEDLSPVQSGVLFYEVCEELIADPQYSTIHAREGGGTASVVMSCTDNIEDDRMQITGWDSKKWYTPLTKESLQEYINNVPYDNWWVDRQEVVRGFYTELINRYEARGGTFPITSFWDPWANQWSGVPKEPLPAPSPPPASVAGSYCVQAYHIKYPDTFYKITEDDTIEAGTC